MAFQALVCTLAVSVSTPSRSNRQARTFSGRPSTGTSLSGTLSKLVGRYHSTMLTCAPPAISPSCNALDGAQASVGEGKGEVLGFLTEVGDEGVQPERVGRLPQHALHQRG